MGYFEICVSPQIKMLICWPISLKLETMLASLVVKLYQLLQPPNCMHGCSQFYVNY